MKPAQSNGIRRTRLSSQGLVLLALVAVLLAAAIIRDINLLMALCGVLTGLLLVSARMARDNLAGVQFQRKALRVVSVGEPFDVEISARNPRRRGAAYLVVVGDSIRSAACSQRHRALLPRIAPQATAAARYRACLTVRGRYQLGPLAVSTAFPLGLVRRLCIWEQPQDLLALPRLGQLTAQWRRREHDTDHAARDSQSRLGMSTGEFHALRDWRPGDSRRLIHWRTSARHGTLMVRQFERHREQDLALVVDLFAPAAAGAGEREKLERIVSFVGTLCADACRRGGCQLSVLLAAAELVVLRGPATQSFLADVLEALAVVQAAEHNRLETALDTALELIPQQSKLILVGTQEGRFTDPQRLAALRHRHRLPLLLARAVTVLPHQLDEWIRWEP